MFERRLAPSGVMRLAAPVLAVVLTMLSGLAMMAAMGKDPLAALDIIFLSPFGDAYSRAELVVKAIPLALMGAGLAMAFRAGVFNIGAPGQYTLGAIFAGGVALFVAPGPWLLPLALVAGALGGALWGWIPAVLRNRVGANEILVSLMLTYVATLLLDWLVRGPWQDPEGRGFPQSALFDPSAIMPVLLEGTRLHFGAVIAIVAGIVLWIVLHHTTRGFGLRAMGMGPRAARFGGFSERGTVLYVFLLSGGLAGLAGAVEVTATIQQLQPDISAGYGFTAIIVAFLGRLDPLGAVVAALALAVTYVGGENAQILLKLPKNATAVFQGMLLFYLLACDMLIHYRPVFRRGG